MSDRVQDSKKDREEGPDMSNRRDELLWEISEDDYEETRDLAEAAARIAEMEAVRPADGMRRTGMSPVSDDREREDKRAEEARRQEAARRIRAREERIRSMDEYGRGEEYPEEEREHSRRREEYPEEERGRSRKREDYPGEERERSRKREDYPGEEREYSRRRETYPEEEREYSRSREEYPGKERERSRKRENYPGEESEHSRRLEDYPEEERGRSRKREDYPGEERERSRRREDYSEEERGHASAEEEYNRTGESGIPKTRGRVSDPGRKDRAGSARRSSEEPDYEETGRRRRSREYTDAGERDGKKARRPSQRERYARDWEDREPDRRASSGKRPSGKKQENPILAFWNGLQTMDKVVGFTGIAVCLFAVVTFVVVAGAKGTEKQVEAFAQVGESMSQITVAGEGTFLAVADAHMARQQAVEDVEQQQEEETYEEVEDNSDVQVGLNMTSVEKDLKIKFVNRKTGKLVPHVDFRVEIKGPDKTWQETDTDKDGIIYLTGLTGGNYTVRIVGPENPAGYVLPVDAQSVTVKGQIEFKKIDVSDEIKSESEVNAAKEDTQVKIPVESVIQDSVEWVESTKTPINGDENAYVEIKKEDIPDPAAVAGREYALFAGMKSRTDRENESERRVLTLSDTTPVRQDRTQTEGPDSPTESSSEEPPSSQEPSSTEPSSSQEPSSEEPSSSQEPSSTEPSSSQEPSSTESSSTPKPETVKVTGISPSATAVTVKVGESVTLTASVIPSNATDQTVNWKSGDTAVATVNAGTITGKSVGSTTITAESPDGPFATIKVTVSAATVEVQKINITGGTSISVGGTLKLTAAPVPENAALGSVTWTSGSTGVATVDSTGLVKGIAAGSAVITAKAANGVAGTVTVTVVAGKSLTVKEMTLSAGETKKADYGATGEIAKTTFSIENTKFATIDANGNIKAIRAGETKYTVTVKYRDGSTMSDTKKLTVKAASVSGITLDKTSVTLKVGESLKLNPKIETGGYTGCLWYTSDKAIVSVEEHGNGTIKALKPGKVTITACSSEDTSKKATCEVTVVSDKDPKADTTTPLKDKNGNRLYYKDANGKYVEAVVADYYKYNVFYRLKDNVEYKYTGWQNIDGKRYFFDKNGNKVTGEQTIQGVKYTFGSDGALNAGSGVLGIDVSRHNGNINWTEVKNSGVSFVIIRCGYRGSATGAMIEDQKFRTNIQGATSAGLKVGIYFFSQAVNRVEAVEEASMTIDLIKNYKISYPVFLDVEAAGGRADGIDAGTRTEIINAYCRTMQDSGYTAGVYANKTWLGSKMSVGSLGSCKIWLAQYAAAPSYNGRYEMWQYSSKGRIGGISGDVDLNISYLGY